MNYSIDCSEIIAQLELQCAQENRQPTGDEYNFIITQLQQANMQLIQCIIKLQQDKETVDSRCANLLKDRGTNQDIIGKQNRELEEYKKTVFQKNATIEGLKEEASDSAKNLEDALKTNEGLLNQVSSLESALNEKDKQIGTLLMQHNLLVHKNKENEETIASLHRDLEHCQCKLRTDGGAIREPASTSISTDLFSSLNLSQSVSHLSVTEANDKYCLSHGKPRSDSRIVKRKIATTPGVVNDSLSNINGQQNLDLLQQQHTFKNDDTSKAKKHSLSDDLGLVKCCHLDEEQEAMIGNILHTTKTQLLQCKKMSGNIHCKSTSLYICLSCGVTYCRSHLYECHSREHTIFMKMKTKQIWCFSCKCDPLPSNSVASLNKEKPSKTREKIKARKQDYNYREDISRKPPCCYRNQRPKSTSWSSSEVAVMWQSPPHSLPSVVPTSTGSTSVTSTTSCSTIGKAFSDRQALNSPSIISSATVTCSYNLSTSYTFSSGIAQDHSTNVTASNISPISISHSNISTVTFDSLPVFTMPTVTKIDTSPTVVREPHIGGKQTINNVTSDTKLSSKGGLKSELMNAPINPVIKKKVTTSTTAIVPVVHSSHGNTLFTSSGTLPSMSRSQMAHKNASTNSNSSTSETKSLKQCSSRPSHKRFSSLDIRDHAATKPSTSSVNENENSLPAHTNTPSIDRLRRRSWSLDSQIFYDLPPFKGLINTGLTCFFNAAVQGLSRIKQFNGLLPKLWKSSDQVLVDLKKQEGYIEVIIPEVKDGEVSKHLSKTIDNIRKPPVTRYEAYFDPSALFSSIQAKYSNSFRQYRQGDAHELMRCILDAVRMEEIEKVKRGIKQGYTGSENGDADTLPNGEDKMLCKAALRGAHKIRTYIDHVIGGELLSVVVCDECKHKVELIEPFLDISLPIPDKNIDSDYANLRSMARYAQRPTLEECFEEYTSKDILDNDNKFICSNCSGEGDEIQLRKAVKQLQLQTLPKVFIIHLKRFSIDYIVTKNSTHVEYCSDIDVKPYCAKNINEKQSTQYSLFAVVQHIGSLNFGHYTAYIKMDDTGLWYKADDSLVSKVQEGEALGQEAYLLFYQQRS